MNISRENRLNRYGENRTFKNNERFYQQVNGERTERTEGMDTIETKYFWSKGMEKKSPTDRLSG